MNENQVLNHLLRDARCELTKISIAEKMPVSTVYETIRKLEREGIIKRYTTLLDTSYLRFSLEYFFVVKGDCPYIYSIDSIECLEIPGTYLVKAFFRSLQEFGDFKKTLKKHNCKILKEFAIQEKIKEYGLVL
ncbi:MAG: Lrp/AsnC family transcriptional regulator [Candidatus Woesearchaeota archaeon]